MPAFSWTELMVPVALVAFFPVIEWVIHVVRYHVRRHRGSRLGTYPEAGEVQTSNEDRSAAARPLEEAR